MSRTIRSLRGCALGLALLLSVSGRVSPVSAFVSSPVGGQAGQLDLALRADIERGQVEPNENRDSWQSAEWEVYTLGAGFTGTALGSLERPFVRLEYSTYVAPAEINEHGTVPAENCRGVALGGGRCQFHPADTGHFLRLSVGADLIHRPSHALSLFLQGNLPIDVDTERFVLPRVDLLAAGLTAAARFESWLTFSTRLYVGSGAFDGAQNATVALVPLFGFEAQRWLLPWKIGVQLGPYFDADLTQRYDSAYDAAYVSGVPVRDDGIIASPDDTRDRIRMMRFGLSVLPYVQITRYLSLEAGYTQKLFGYDTPATRFFSVGVRGAFGVH